MMLKDIIDYSTANPYQELTYTLATEEFTEIRAPYNFFRILSLSANDSLSVKFGASGIETPFSGSFMGLRFDYVYDRLMLKNTGITSLIVTIALGLGDIWDDRNNDPLPTSLRASQPTVTTITPTKLNNGSGLNPIIIGAGASDLYVGGSVVNTSNGFLLRANQQLPPIFYEGDIYGIRSAGSAAAYVLEFTE